MKYYMILSLFLLASCSAVRTSPDAPGLGDIIWNLSAIGQEPVDFGDRAFIKFDENEGRASGRALCNSFFSGYEKDAQNISFSAIGSTKMYCEELMDKEGRILADLQKVSRYEIRSDTLYLYAGDSLVLTFKK